ncbi:MAG: hypothetical protein JSV48_08865 [Bradyrhizobium sp.]|nr:MAG: hypothetical protein JSV48_08865 [Bradyrhizobium sp.]
MLHPVSPPDGVTAPPYSDRIGFAQLTRRAFEGGDLHPLREHLLARIAEGTAVGGQGLAGPQEHALQRLRCQALDRVAIEPGDFGICAGCHAAI